jgi:hypothetical protein
MMISNSQTSNHFRNVPLLGAIALGVLMIVDAFFGSIIKENIQMKVVEYGVISFALIATFRELVKETGQRLRMQKAFSFHGL